MSGSTSPSAQGAGPLGSVPESAPAPSGEPPESATDPGEPDPGRPATTAEVPDSAGPESGSTASGTEATTTDPTTEGGDTESPAGRPEPPPGSASIDRPGPDVPVTNPVTISGTADLAEGSTLWVLVRPPSGEYFLTTLGPVSVDDSGHWVTEARLGRRNRHDEGKRYDLVVVPAEPSNDPFGTWMSLNPGRYGPVPAPPTGTVLAVVTVILGGPAETTVEPPG